VHLAWYNNRRTAMLGFLSPNQRLASFAPDFGDASSLRSSAPQKSA